MRVIKDGAVLPCWEAIILVHLLCGQNVIDHELDEEIARIICPKDKLTGFVPR